MPKVLDRFSKILFSIIFIGIIFLILPTSVNAATYYVTKSGNDSTGNGSEGNPWLTLNKAESSASNGDTVHVGAGTYVEDDPSLHGWTSNKGIAWIADGAVTVQASSTAIRVLYLTSTNTASFTGFTFDAVGTRTYAVNFATGVSNKTFTNCTFTGATTSLVTANGTVSNFVIDSSTFNQGSTTAQAYGAGVGNQTLSNNTFNVTSATSIIRISASGSNMIFDGNTVTSSTLTQVFNITNSTDLTVSDNTFNINGSSTRVIQATIGTGTVGISGNTINFASVVQAFNFTSGTWALTIDNNTITSSVSNPSQSLINIIDQVSPNITNNTIESVAASAVTHVSITSTGTAGGTPQVSNNILRSRSTSGYVISIGTEGSTSGDNKLDGAIIERNTIYGALYYDSSLTGVGTHSIFYSYNKNAIIRYNTVIGGGYGIVVKGGGMTWTTGGLFNNKFINSNSTNSVRIKGVKNLNVFNNTVYVASNFLNDNEVIYISENGSGETSTGVVLKNNIIVGGGVNSLIVVDSGSQTGFTSDYNLFYRHNSGSIGKIASTVYNFSEWNTLGYDTHSLNGNPNFVDTVGYDFKLLPSSPAINNGTSVGLSTDFAGNSVPQGSSPDIGVYEFLIPSSAPSSLVQYKSNGSTVITTGNLTNESPVVLKFSMSSPNSIDSLTPQVEVRPIGTAFTNVVTHSGSAVAYSGSSVTGSIDVNGLNDDRYHWQARISNPAGQSSWISYGGNAESSTDFEIDDTPPSISLTPFSPDPTTDNTPTFTGTATEVVGTVVSVEYQIDSTSGSWSSCVADDGSFDEASETFSCTPLELSRTSHTIFVRATDSNGNTTSSGNYASDAFTIASNSSSSNNNNDDDKDDNECHDDVGIQPPWLYGAIAQNSNSILLYFTEAADPVDRYALKFGIKSGEYIYGADNLGIKSESRMTYLVKELKPNTSYYFKVRGGNGCKPGDWSNEIKATTKSAFSYNNLEFTSSNLESTPFTKDDLDSSGINSTNDPTTTSENIDKKAMEEIVDTEGYTVKVKVIDEQGNPVEGANVTMHSKVQEAVSDKNGYAIFNNVEKGDHRVIIAYNGFEGEQALNLTGDVKEFSIEIKVKPQSVFYSPIYLWSIGIFAVITTILVILLIRRRR